MFKSNVHLPKPLLTFLVVIAQESTDKVEKHKSMKKKPSKAMEILQRIKARQNLGQFVYKT